MDKIMKTEAGGDFYCEGAFGADILCSSRVSSNHLCWLDNLTTYLNCVEIMCGSQLKHIHLLREKITK